MTKKVKFIVLLVLIFFIAVLFFYFFNKPKFVLSESQKEIVESLGRPDQFTISYLPQGESNLARHEIWFYLNYEQKISFLNGELILSEDIKNDLSKRNSTNLKSEDFDFYVSAAEVKNKISSDDFILVDAPVFSDTENGIETYASSQALFIFEQGYLTYMETLD